MSILDNVKNIYFLGVGGIGMSGLARWCNQAGFRVAGYDLTETELTNSLEEEGISVSYEDSVSTLGDSFLDYETTLVVYTPAIPEDSNLYLFFREENFQLIKRSELLGELTKKHYTIGVAGTHGKTTTSSMLAHLLKVGGLDCTAFLGGIATNYNSNVIISNELTKDTRIVVEADEFDRSFLNLSPKTAVITSVDADHLDIYGDKGALLDSFNQFASKLPSEATLLLSENINQALLSLKDNSLKIKSYGLSSSCDIFAENLRVENGAFVFDYRSSECCIEGLVLHVMGFHNVENMLAAISLALAQNVSKTQVLEGVKTFLGVKRRFQYIKNENSFVFIDDYAHHPTEIEALLKSVKKLYPTKKILAIFQPHLYSRTRDFAEDFAKSLSLVDDVFLLDIYPAREEPIEGVDSDVIFKPLLSKNKKRGSKADLLNFLESSEEPEVLLTIGAGDIVDMISPILERVKCKV